MCLPFLSLLLCQFAVVGWSGSILGFSPSSVQYEQKIENHKKFFKSLFHKESLNTSMLVLLRACSRVRNCLARDFYILHARKFRVLRCEFMIGNFWCFVNFFTLAKPVQIGAYRPKTSSELESKKRQQILRDSETADYQAKII